MVSLKRTAALAALLLLLCACRVRAMESPCDGMGEEDIAGLKKVQNPAAAAVRWAVPFTAAAARDTNLNKVFSKKSCKFTSYTVKKLCVPQVWHVQLHARVAAAAAMPPPLPLPPLACRITTRSPPPVLPCRAASPAASVSRSTCPPPAAPCLSSTASLCKVRCVAAAGCMHACMRMRGHCAPPSPFAGL